MEGEPLSRATGHKSTEGRSPEVIFSWKDRRTSPLCHTVAPAQFSGKAAMKGSLVPPPRSAEARLLDVHTSDFFLDEAMQVCESW